MSDDGDYNKWALREIQRDLENGVYMRTDVYEARHQAILDDLRDQRSDHTALQTAFVKMDDAQRARADRLTWMIAGALLSALLSVIGSIAVFVIVRR